MKQRIKQIFLRALLVIVGYFVIGIILHHIFPEQTPDYATYFKNGDELKSVSEGFDQTIVSQKDGWVSTVLVVKPKAAGPPEHIHSNFDETFTVKAGVLSILVNGEKKTIQAGESFTIPKGTAHKPFNETDNFVIVESGENEMSLPVEFAYHLSQIYPFVDGLGENPSIVAMMLQFAVYGNEMDAYLADGPPVGVQKALRVLMAPTARLLGYKKYYEQYRVKHHS